MYQYALELSTQRKVVEEVAKPARSLPPPVAAAKERQKAAVEEMKLADVALCEAEDQLRKAQERLEKAKRAHLRATEDLRRMGINGNKSPVRAYDREQKKKTARAKT